MPSLIRNPSVDALTLPYPLRGVLIGGQGIMLSDSKASLLSLCPGIGGTFKVSDMPNYTGPFDSTYGPTADDPATESVPGLESAADKTNLDALVTYLSAGQQTAINRALRGYQGVNAQVGTSYTPVLTDAGKVITLTNAGAISVTIPLEASVAWANGDLLTMIQTGAGVATIAGAGGVTINHLSATLATAGQGACVHLVKVGTNIWNAYGNFT